ncbi:hypothetical protein VTL71DRAFT_14177 [Oculimacula yallundae]|uniref:Uncharacterized protein n=1 Tax=Oculimacula yallundae TaxID=86028 RepID=A0ABR4CHR7_9HELO
MSFENPNRSHQILRESKAFWLGFCRTGVADVILPDIRREMSWTSRCHGIGMDFETTIWHIERDHGWKVYMAIRGLIEWTFSCCGRLASRSNGWLLGWMDGILERWKGFTSK